MKYEASAASFCGSNWQGALALTWDRLLLFCKRRRYPRLEIRTSFLVTVRFGLAFRLFSGCEVDLRLFGIVNII